MWVFIVSNSRVAAVAARLAVVILWYCSIIIIIIFFSLFLQISTYGSRNSILSVYLLSIVDILAVFFSSNSRRNFNLGVLFLSGFYSCRWYFRPCPLQISSCSRRCNLISGVLFVVNFSPFLISLFLVFFLVRHRCVTHNCFLIVYGWTNFHQSPYYFVIYLFKPSSCDSRNLTSRFVNFLVFLHRYYYRFCLLFPKISSCGWRNSIWCVYFFVHC